MSEKDDGNAFMGILPVNVFLFSSCLFLCVKKFAVLVDLFPAKIS